MAEVVTEEFLETVADLADAARKVIDDFHGVRSSTLSDLDMALLHYDHERPS